MARLTRTVDSWVVNVKYPDEHGYEADMGKGLYDPEVFSDLTFDTLRRYKVIQIFWVNDYIWVIPAPSSQTRRQKQDSELSMHVATFDWIKCMKLQEKVTNHGVEHFQMNGTAQSTNALCQMLDEPSYEVGIDMFALQSAQAVKAEFRKIHNRSIE